MKTVRRPPYPKWNPGYFPCSSLTPLPLSSRRPSVSFGGFGLRLIIRRLACQILEAVPEVVLRLTLTIGPDSLAAELAREIAAGDHTVVDVIERLIGRHLEGSVSEMLGNRLIKAPRVVVHPDYYKNRFENLDALSREGYSTWYPEVRFSTSKSDNLAIAELETVGFGHGYVKYGGSIDQSYKYTKKVLKRELYTCLTFRHTPTPLAGLLGTLGAGSP